MLDRDKININNSETRILLAIFETLEEISSKMDKLTEIKEEIKTKKEVNKNGGSNTRNKSKAAT